MRNLIRVFLAASAIAAIYTFGTGAIAESPKVGDQGKAPEFVNIDHWLNSEPLTMQQLRGKVVLVDFWTYSCINCVNTLPYVKQWYEKYKDQGLVVVGVHTPEFPFEKSTANVQAALKRFDIRYPVAQDNMYGTWSAYRNQYWPATYLIDTTGRIVYQHYGEGRYKETEAEIQRLLAASKTVPAR
ncbi:thioredoxin family protein [Cupriavidus alkaliphilus]|uniref:thioredoxin family protein n=1 Tax=Cupriavidus alkaliphilus TaxID=942866 RepID=UPI000815EE6C|nr:thioredoxin family protein [Cupriavidus alkaliphilus]PVY77792.1 peroxiredoxin [Cupriavidus alkaliphilus]RAS07046.1 peroxiredoxin [Cupriavidus alkaliphilus]SCB18926.1 Peroxiredoxin [Cupriavidus alkaliphilus]